MASNYLVQIALAHDTGLPEDITVNTWSCRTAATGDLVALGLFIDELEAFYASMDADLSSLLSGAYTIRAYDRADAEPRVPVVTVTGSLTPGTDAAPGEVALCMSFQGVTMSGAPQARRRGRIYLGPLAGGVMNLATGRPEAGTRGRLQNAGDAFVTLSKASAQWKWQVWSTVNQSGVDVDNGWVDDSFDTMRSRGNRATTRSTFS